MTTGLNLKEDNSRSRNRWETKRSGDPGDDRKNGSLLDLDGMEKLRKTLDTSKIDPPINYVKENMDITMLRRKFTKLFKENHIVKGLEVKIQLKEDAKVVQQKRRPIPIHLQQSVGKEFDKLMKQGYTFPELPKRSRTNGS